MSRLGFQLAQPFEVVIRAGVGCFILIIVFIVTIGVAGSFHKNASEYRPSVSGPRQPIPNVNSATLATGSRLYQTEGCSNCHGHIGDSPVESYMPNLTHEGRRNASIEWQMLNLSQHHRLFPNPSMPDYADLPPDQLRALASYMATRR